MLLAMLPTLEGSVLGAEGQARVLTLPLAAPRLPQKSYRALLLPCVPHNVQERMALRAGSVRSHPGSQVSLKQTVEMEGGSLPRVHQDPL